MLNIHIDGTFTYSDNVKQLKLGDTIKLLPNINNRINSEAIGAYTVDNKKIGYIPFTKNQVDIKSKYKVSKIQLLQNNPLLVISREINSCNIIKIEYNDKSMSINNDVIQELKRFHKYLEKDGHNIKLIKILYLDLNFINILIKTENEEIIFYTVTKKYYDEHIFIYDEFYNLGLIPKNIYQPFQIHRLEEYIKKKYRPIDKLKNYKSKINDIMDDLLDLSSYDKSEIDLSNYKKDGLCYNHTLKTYCYIDYYDENDVLFEIEEFNKKNLQDIILRLIITDKSNINIICGKILYKKKFDL
jgi:hypothetical protein